MTRDYAWCVQTLQDARGAIDSFDPQALRSARANLVTVAVFLSYAIGVLSVDLELIHHSATNEDLIDNLESELPSILSKGWVGGGWSLSPEASASILAARELSEDHAQDLLQLHEKTALANFRDREEIEQLEKKIQEEKLRYTTTRDECEKTIKHIQSKLLALYKNKTIDPDEWLESL